LGIGYIWGGSVLASFRRIAFLLTVIVQEKTSVYVLRCSDVYPLLICGQVLVLALLISKGQAIGGRNLRGFAELV